MKMEKNFIRIAHLSDLHFSTSNDTAHYDAVKSDISSLNSKPDVVVVTGDIADNIDMRLNISSLRKSFDLAKTFLESLCKRCGIEPKERLFIVPGNHDYRYMGIWNKKGHMNEFKYFFKDYFQHKYIEDLDLLVGCFDSNTTNSKINFATGEVITEEFNRFNEFKNCLHGKPASTKKIALLHHHPMPIYRAEVTGRPFSLDREEFLLLKNSGTFMREMLKNNVRLIFHGHKHHRGVSKASFPVSADTFRNIGIISAASIGKITDNEYSFNIVDFFDDGSVTVDFWIRRGEGTYEREGGSPFILFDSEEARLFRFQDLKSKAPSIAKRITFVCKISDSGKIEEHIFFDNWVSNQDPLEQFDVQIVSSTGVFPDEPPKFTEIKPVSQQIECKLNGSPENGVQKAVIVFNPPLNKEPISAKLERNVPNAISFFKEDRLAATERTSDKEIVYRALKNYVAEQMTLIVQFPPGFKPINPQVWVKDSVGKLQSKERYYCQKYFCYSELLNCSFVRINYPLFQNEYGIIWDLPLESQIKATGISPSKLGKAEEIKKRLLSIASTEKGKDRIRDCLAKIFREIMQLKFLSTKDADNRLEVCVVAYDKSIGKLRYVAHFCRGGIRWSNSSILDWTIVNGQPVAGMAFKMNEVALMFFPIAPSAAASQYLRRSPCEFSTNEYFTAFVAIPLAYPSGSKNVVGVLELASCSNTSVLLKLDDGDDISKMAKKATLLHIAETNFLKYICEALEINIEA